MMNPGERSLLFREVNDRIYELLASGLVFKRYACCGALHSAVDALLELRAEHNLTAADVRQITCQVNLRAPRVLVHHSPATGDEGRFSVEHAMAVALVDGAAGLAQFDDEPVEKVA